MKNKSYMGIRIGIILLLMIFIVACTNQNNSASIDNNDSVASKDDDITDTKDDEVIEDSNDDVNNDSKDDNVNNDSKDDNVNNDSKNDNVNNDLKNDESTTNKNEEPKVSDYEMLSKSNSLIASNVTKIAKINAPTIEVPYTVTDENGDYYSAKHTGMQGGCFDGRYYYQSFLKYCYNKTKDSNGNYVYSKGVNNAKNLVVIVKYDVELQKVVKVSEPMFLNHANDMTYNSKQNLLVVVHGSPNGKTLSYVDPETLELKETFKVKHNLYGIDYDETTNRYALGVSGSYGFSISNNLTDAGKILYGQVAAKAYTVQTLCCDENYVYCLYYGNGTNKLTGATGFTKDAIFVYDWSGKFVTFIEVDFGSEETENISVVNGEIYVATLGILYKVGGFVEAK